MIAYGVTVRRHGSSEVVERETVSGNTERTAQAAKAAAVRWLAMLYPPETHSIDVRKVRS